MLMQVSYKKQFLLMIMFLAVVLTLLEIISRTYDYFNPKCNLMVNPVAEDLDFWLKAEICRAWLYHIPYDDPLTGIRSYEPNQHGPTLNINSYGFRGPELQNGDPDKTFRIFMVGGSTTFAIRAISDQHTIPGYLQENFNQINGFKKIEVVNAGFPGIRSADELQLIKNKIVNMDPDMIIIYDGVNDVRVPYNSTRIHSVVNELGNIYKKYFSFFETIRVFDRMIERSGPNMGPTQKIPIDESTSQEKAILWKNNLSAICKIGKQKDFDTVIILQPFLGTGNKILTEHEKTTYEILEHSEVVRAYQFFSNEFEDLKNYCIHTIDLMNIFDDIQGSVYYDGAHLRHEYNKAVADRIFEEIIPLIEYIRVEV